MAFGKGGSYSPGTTLYSFQIKSKDLPAPVFHVKKKGEDGEYVEISKDTTKLSGHLIGVQPKENTNPKDGKVIKSVNLTFEDRKAKGGTEVYFLNVGYTYLGRNILNSLLALKSFDDIEISLYQSKPKPGGQYKTGFASVAVRQHGQMIYGKFDDRKGELPKIEKVMVGDTKVSNDKAINAFFLKEITEFAQVVKAAAPTPVEAAQSSPSKGEPIEETHQEAGVHAGAPTSGENLDEDVPF